MLDIIKMEAEITKLAAETAKLNREGRWYPVAVASALMGAGAALMGAFLALSKLIVG
ncbi:hypothetical protein [Xenophilus azovorans]|uniref:hypothetical protein n=1 Tax=Xenophilus azovorans TaxID=151755 RepID=UPI001FDF6D99|nr:hypothetical protein [Xenophilus azovorans]